MGLWSRFLQPLAAITMVTRMGYHQHHGKGNGTHSGGLCCLGSSISTQERGVPSRQPRFGSSYQQGLIIRQNHDAPD